jgi:hypothetical protein
MALARTGAIPGLSGIIGTGGLGGISGGSGTGQRLGELDLQELERRQRLVATGLPTGNGPLTAQSQAQQPQPETESSGASSASPSGNPPNGQKPASMMGMAQSEFSGAGESAAGRGSGPRGDNCVIADKEQRRDPGSVVVPCRARGMPMDHNFKVSRRYLKSYEAKNRLASFSFALKRAAPVTYYQQRHRVISEPRTLSY